MTRLPRVLDANLRESRRLHPYAESISEKIIPLSYATLDISKEEAVADRALIELYNPNGSAGIYRARLPKDDIVNDVISLQLEHSVAEVGDYLVKDAINEELSLSAAFRKVFSHYKGNLWRLGSINANETVLLNVDYENVLETLIGLLDQCPQYYMTFDFSQTPWVLNLAQKTNVITAEGRIGRNITSAVVNRDDKDLCTRAFVRGLPKPAGREDDENAVGYMEADTINLHGVVEREVPGSDLTEAQARRVAENYLASHKNPKLSIEIDGIDLASVTGETLDKFLIGKRFRLAVPHKGIVLDDVITAVNWADVYNTPEVVRIVVGAEQDASIEFYKEQSSASKASRRGSKSQAKKNESYDWNLERTDEFGNILHQAGMHLDADGFLVYSRDNVNNIGSMFDVRDNMIKAEVTNRQNADDVLNGKLTVEADRITAEVTRASTKEGELAGRITVASNKITAEVTRATQKEGELAGRITVESNRITQEVTRATQAEGDLSGRITTTATEINAEVTRAKAAENSLSGRITVNSNKVAIVVEEKNGQNVVKAASIVTAINNSESSIRLDADKVYIGSQKSTTVINGKLNASDVTATYLAAKFANTSVLSTRYAFSNTYECDTFICNDYTCAVENAYHALQIVQDGNNYKLQGKHFYSSDWADIGTFSRAINSASWSWVGGAPRVTLSPQGQNFTGVAISGITFSASTKSWATDKKSFSQDFYCYDANSNTVYTENLSINTRESYEAGFTDGQASVSHDIDIPTGQIYTSDRYTGTRLNTLKTKYEQAKTDGDYVMFRVDCGGTSKWYYMEP